MHHLAPSLKPFNPHLSTLNFMRDPFRRNLDVGESTDFKAREETSVCLAKSKPRPLFASLVPFCLMPACRVSGNCVPLHARVMRQDVGLLRPQALPIGAFPLLAFNSHRCLLNIDRWLEVIVALHRRAMFNE